MHGVKKLAPPGSMLAEALRVGSTVRTFYIISEPLLVNDKKPIKFKTIHRNKIVSKNHSHIAVSFAAENLNCISCTFIL